MLGRRFEPKTPIDFADEATYMAGLVSTASQAGSRSLRRSDECIVMRGALLSVAIVLLGLPVAMAQSAGTESVDEFDGAPDATAAASNPEAQPERWNLFYQATTIGQYHGTFRSPYAGAKAFRATRSVTCLSPQRCSSAYGWRRIRSSTLILRSPADADSAACSGLPISQTVRCQESQARCRRLMWRGSM